MPPGSVLAEQGRLQNTGALQHMPKHVFGTRGQEQTLGTPELGVNSHGVWADEEDGAGGRAHRHDRQKLWLQQQAHTRAGAVKSGRLAGAPSTENQGVAARTTCGSGC